MLVIQIIAGKSVFLHKLRNNNAVVQANHKTKIMNIRTFLTAMAALLPLGALPCTSLIAGKNATADGSVFVTYAADSHTLYGELYNTPAADHAPGEMRKIHEWDTGRYLGEIPQPAHTYATIGNMNEHGLTIAESTWGGRAELEDTTGIMDYGSLIYVTMELIGKGGKEKGAVWVARRIPDDCISGHANFPRIHKFPLNDKENTIYSPDVIDFARKMGYYKGKDEDFSFSSAYGELDGTATRGCDGRVWSYFNRFKSGMDKYLPWILDSKGEVMPLWVKPDKKVDANDMDDARPFRKHPHGYDQGRRRRPLRCALPMEAYDLQGGRKGISQRACYRHTADRLLVRLTDERLTPRPDEGHTVVRR